ncbi:MAG: di-heme enzyme [Gemmatimonadales bacterium]
MVLPRLLSWQRGTRRAAAAAALGLLAGWAVLSGCRAAVPANDPPFVWTLPAGFPEPRVPADEPMSAAKVDLGRHLFYDRRLSGNGTQSCSSCHIQALAFTDGRGQAIGSTGERHPRGSLSLANVAYQPVLTWANPVLRDLNKQAVIPMFGEFPVELGLKDDGRYLADLANDTTYQRLFRQAFPRTSAVTLGLVTRALAAFQRTLISGDSPVDRARRGERALDDLARRGQELFQSDRLGCARCHRGLTFSSAFDHAGLEAPEVAFHNNGLYNVGGTGAYPYPNTGLVQFTEDSSDMGRFKAPTLRNIALTAPYMHDGSLATLDKVIDHYAAGGRTVRTGPDAGVGRTSRFKSPLVTGFRVTPAERRALIAFLVALTDSTFITDPRFSDPWIAPRLP